VEQILVMTVEPGFGGQSFMAEMMPKVRAVADYARERGLTPWIQVDGGISVNTIAVAAEAGANTFVAGSSVYATDVEPEQAIARLRAAADNAVTG
jgi:ribulose-phosphate 3-epimerase